jgi:hypothetical protein
VRIKTIQEEEDNNKKDIFKNEFEAALLGVTL